MIFFSRFYLIQEALLAEEFKSEAIEEEQNHLDRVRIGILLRMTGILFGDGPPSDEKINEGLDQVKEITEQAVKRWEERNET